MSEMLSAFFAGTDLWTLAVIVGLAIVTVLARGFFMISDQQWQLPHTPQVMQTHHLLSLQLPLQLLLLWLPLPVLLQQDRKAMVV